MVHQSKFHSTQNRFLTRNRFTKRGACAMHGEAIGRGGGGWVHVNSFSSHVLSGAGTSTLMSCSNSPQLAIWDRTLSPHTLKAAIIDRSWDFMICMLYGLRTYVGTHIIQHIIEPYFISRVYFFNFSCLFHCKSQHRGGDGHQVQRQPNLWRPTPLQLHPPLWRPDLTKMTNYMPSKIFMSSTHRSSTDHIIDL
jgi:hypothetical protein